MLAKHASVQSRAASRPAGSFLVVVAEQIIFFFIPERVLALPCFGDRILAPVSMA